MTTPDAAATLSPAVAAHQRAMPVTRLIDCGMAAEDARRLMSETAAGAAWDLVAADIAEQRLAQSRRRDNEPDAARDSARQAAAALLFAQMAFNQDNDRKRELYRLFAETVALYGELRNPALERLDLRYKHGELVGWLALPATARAAATVVVWGGLSGWGAAYLRLADALNARGLACLLAEGPGQGESRLNGRLYLDEHVVDGFSRFVDAVVEDERLGDRIGVHGNSFGGLFAALVAARDRRVSACCVNGAPTSPTVPEFRTAREQILAATGLDDVAAARAVLETWRFDARRDRLSCPLLLLQGGRDPLAPFEAQRGFLDATAEGAGTLREWPDGEHTIYNHADERDGVTADWFAANL